MGEIIIKVPGNEREIFEIDRLEDIKEDFYKNGY